MAKPPKTIDLGPGQIRIGDAVLRCESIQRSPRSSLGDHLGEGARMCRAEAEPEVLIPKGFAKRLARRVKALAESSPR